jgi:hypothetical protein
MMKPSKILLSIAVLGLVGGSVIDFYFAKVNPALTAVLPVGAIVFGLFLIVNMLEKEIAKYDEEQAQKMQMFHNSTEPVARQPDQVVPPITVHLKEKTI